ncbi:MAG: hypothetical protein COZ28_03115 [Candidatus Moranbacteria bacterium CG_4_10_14_3_um_filter_44_15]|nr:MAG: hypothetical protein COW51_04530 [Candidatus Moranbacteria bacterium CG17_big_fil_post_rev_8_21_14_2_50_44_12]PIW93505.1 MAG: hypothetical protein COZ87_00870 [Candidatus Moranbacteria bacterium CG_4_8_14_3_um_filter_43_15]PIX90550.1 MAG: hypothetical protein COZ28_03115 [Candidatus Moranbacteria bacterium CG_4_10_14_3_um_filter_44_15]PJA86185.1 MAG: hypothetical protein CO142_01665 [Candidatus Moranbacteria bacterium CG_4_9_14_3_um_filter_44_28]
MTSFQRGIKRVAIILVYIAIISVIATALYYLFRAKPTCTDGKRNQGEEKIDCGGPCAKCEEIPKIENIQILQKALIPAGPGKYDVLVKIKNPNALFGVAGLDYSLNFLNQEGIIVEKRDGSSFILPAQTKYVLEFNIALGEKPESFVFNVRSFRWQKFSESEEPNVVVYGREVSLPGSIGEPTQLKAKIQNRSNYDFKKVTTKVVFKDVEGMPVAVNQTDSNDVRANEEREVIFNWNTVLPKNIDLQSIEIEPEVNAFGSENFMKKYGSPEQYQSYDVDDAK